MGSELARSFCRRAQVMLEQAQRNLSSGYFPEAVSAAQESIEFSLKSICLEFLEKYPRKHSFTGEELLGTAK